MPKRIAQRNSERQLSQVIRFTIPLILTSIIQQIHGLLDNMIAGNFASEAVLGAVGATSYLSSAMINLLVGISVGISTVVAQLEGERNPDSTRKVVHSSMALSILGGVSFGLLGIFLSRPLLSLLQTPASIIDDSALYLRIYFAGLPFLIIYNFCAGILRAKGDTKRPLLYLTLSGSLKIPLSLLFVAVFRWGAAALALSTVIANALAASLVVRALIKAEQPYRLRLREIKFHKLELLRILRCGVPIGLQSSALSLSNVILQSSINSLGSAVVAGSAASGTYNSIFYTLQNTVSHTATIFCGKYFGAKRYDLLKRALLACFVVVMIIGTIMAAVCLPFIRPMMQAFVQSEEAIQSGGEVIIILCTTYWLSGLMEVVSGGLRAINKSTYAMVSTVLCLCLVRIIWIYTYFPGHRSLGALFLSYPLSWGITLLAGLGLFVFFFRKLKKKEALPNPS